MVEEEEELEERDPLFKKKLLVVVLAPILAVGVDVDAANESAVSGVLKVTPAIELFLLSACSNSGNLGTESFAPATTVEKLLKLSGFGSELTPNSPADSIAEDEEANVSCGILSALETETKLATGKAAFGSLDEASLSPKLNMGGATFDSFDDADLSYVKDDSVAIITGGTATLVEVAFGNAKPLFSATTGPSEVTTSVFWFNAELAGGLNPNRDGGFSSVTTSAELVFLSATET